VVTVSEVLDALKQADAKGFEDSPEWIRWDKAFTEALDNPQILREALICLQSDKAHLLEQVDELEARLEDPGEPLYNEGWA